MNFKFKNILLGAAGLVGVTTVALSAGCNKDDAKPVDGSSGGNGTEAPWVKDPSLGTVTLLGQTSTMAERVANSVGNKSNTNPDAENAQFAQEVKTKIVIGHTFAQGSVQSVGIDQIIAVYNGLVQKNKAAFEEYKKTHADDQDGLNFASPVGLSLAAKEVDTKPLGSGYSAGANAVTQAVQNGNPNFADIVLNYAPVASALGSKNMLLSFNDNEPELNLDLTNFSNNFTAINAETQNVDKPSSWILPALKSTNVLSLNAPVMNYILDTILKNGGSIKADDTKMAELYKTIQQKGAADASVVSTTWGKPVSNIKDLCKDYVVSYSIFENYKELLEFAKFAQGLFEKSVNNNKPANASVHIFGVDSATSLYEQALFSILDGDTSKMIQSVNHNNDGVQISYTTLQKDGSAANQGSKQIYDTVKASVEAGGTKLFPGGQFSSRDQQKHKFAFSIGSTAGYSHNFVKGEITNYVLTLNNQEVSALNFNDKNGKFSDVRENYGTGYQLVTLPDVAGLQSAQADTPADKVTPLYLLGSKMNGIYAYNALTATALKNTLPGKYSQMFATQEDQTLFESVVKDAKTNSRKTISQIGFLVLPYDSKEADQKAFLELAKNKKLYAGMLKNDSKDKVTYQIILAFKDGVTDTYAISESANDTLKSLGYSIEKKSQANFLGEDELISLPTPTKWVKENTKNVVFGQGPSIMGLVSNQTDELATKQFMKWLITSTTKYVFDPDDKQQTEYTPRDYIQKQMSYILPYAGFENVSLEDAAANFIGTNAYLKVAFEQFKKVATDPTYVIFEEPGSLRADGYRKAIDAAWDGLQTSVTTGQTVQDFTKFVTEASKQ
ncbi:P68 family surface lipoprotein [Mycoplasma sp. 1458C]|uniref:P68 family surface lipoprotein n=1 Tax=unclassified Mycoplasma TaxID=2683645 RepID=UPI003AB07B47